MVGGVHCAGEILDRPLLVEMMLGTVLADPAAIPADPDGFDPLEYCRGAACGSAGPRAGPPARATKPGRSKRCARSGGLQVGRRR